MSVKLEGLTDLTQWLTVTAPDLARQLAGDLVMDTAKAIADEAKANMPSKTGKMKKATRARKARSSKTQAVANVECKAFYWIFLEHGDGPDGVEHAMFRRAEETVKAGLDRAEFPRFKRRLAGAFK